MSQTLEKQIDVDSWYLVISSIALKFQIVFSGLMVEYEGIRYFS